jgi:hypothetical protein
MNAPTDDIKWLREQLEEHVKRLSAVP